MVCPSIATPPIREAGLEPSVWPPCVLRSSLHVSTDCTPRTGALVERLRSTCSECLGDLTTVRQCLGHTVSRLSEGYSNKSRVTEGSGASQVTRLRRVANRISPEKRASRHLTSRSVGNPSLTGFGKGCPSSRHNGRAIGSSVRKWLDREPLTVRSSAQPIPDT